MNGGLIFELWPLWLMILLSLLARHGPKLLKKYKERRKATKLMMLGLEGLDEISGREFELLLSELFLNMGWKVEVTAAANDWGADLVISKENRTTVVQAKRWNRPVGVKAVQEVVASMPMYNANQAIVVTNSTFTNQAAHLAKVNNVELWDRTKLVASIAKVRRRKR